MGDVDVVIYHDIKEIETDWKLLEKIGFSTIYQSYHWCNTWLSSGLKIADIEPSYVVGRDSTGNTLFIIPLQRRRRKGFTVLEFLSASLVSYGHLVCHDWCKSSVAREWFNHHFDGVLNLLEPYDVLYLKDMPLCIGEIVHPLTGYFNIQGPDSSLATTLSGSLEQFVASKRSSDSRKNIRYRDSKLMQAGKLTLETELKDQELNDALEELFADQGNRLREAGVNDPFGPNEREFFKSLAQSGGEGGCVFRVIRLSLDGRGLSSILAALHNGTCSNLMTSLAASPLRKYSPGDLVLRKLIGLGCELGMKRLDLGIGDHDYKRQWADDDIHLFHTIRGRSLKGIVCAAIIYAEQTARRSIKTQRQLRTLFFALRRRFFGKIR